MDKGSWLSINDPVCKPVLRQLLLKYCKFMDKEMTEEKWQTNDTPRMGPTQHLCPTIFYHFIWRIQGNCVMWVTSNKKLLAQFFLPLIYLQTNVWILADYCSNMIVSYDFIMQLLVPIPSKHLYGHMCIIG